MPETSTDTRFHSRLYLGAVSHRRLKPVSHHFKYRVFSALFDLDELASLSKTNRWFSHNHFNILSFHDKDHGSKDGAALRPWIETNLKQGGYDYPLGKVLLHCFPRLFGLVFNPISVWFCYDTDGDLRTILYEVRNTFGEWRGYLLPVDKHRVAGSLIRQECDKSFYVSPLMEMDCHYHFTIAEPDSTYTIAIRETQKGERILLAAQTGKAQPFVDKEILKTVFTHPLQYFKVVLAIHFEAVRTLLKGVKFVANPKTKTGDVTFPNKAKQPAE